METTKAKNPTLQGKVRISSSQKGVQGLSIDAWRIGGSQPERICGAVSRLDGSFHVGLSETTGKRDKASKDIALRISDRHGQVLLTKEVASPSFPGTSPETIDLTLDEEQLGPHLSQPLSWQRPRHPPISGLQRSEIRRALDLLRGLGGPRYRRLLNELDCPGPMMDDWAMLEEESWNVLQGEPGSAVRLRDRLDARHRTSPGARNRAQELLSLRENHPKPAGGGVAEQARPSRRASIPPEHSTPLFMAAVQIARGDPELATRYIGAVLDVLCGAPALKALHRAAVDVLANPAPTAMAHLGSLISQLGFPCGPDNGFVPEIPVGCPPIDEIAEPSCLQEILGGIGNFATIYHVDSVTPQRPCLGDTITITGSGFGDEPRPVQFRRRGSPQEWQDVEALSWRDTEIVVEVPDSAGCGFRLTLPRITRGLCGRFIDVTPLGPFDVQFETGIAEIVEFLANDQPGNLCIEPGGDLTLTWRTCGAESTSILLSPLGIGDGHAEPSGSWSTTLPSHTNMTTRITASLIAKGPCPRGEASHDIDFWLHRKPNLTIHGIEVTQGIQHYRSSEHLTDPDDQGDDNSLRLVAGKAAYVRLYLRSGQVPGFDHGSLGPLQGELRVEKIAGNALDLLTTLSPQNTTNVNALHGYEIYEAERGDINASMNFLIPAHLMSGKLRLTALVEVTNLDAVPCGGGSATHSVDITVDLNQTLSVVGIPVGYFGPEIDPHTPIGATLMPPNLPDLDTLNQALSRTLAMLPVNETPITSIIEPVLIDYRLDGARLRDGGCSANWYKLLNLKLLPARIADGNHPNRIYYGMIPHTMPAEPRGCAAFGVTGSLFRAAGATPGQRRTLAHEISHVLGLAHAPCGNVGYSDPSYPAYEPYDPTLVPNAKLGEYGLDNRDGDIYPPSRHDYMSYCDSSNSWISVFSHNRLLSPGGPLQTNPVPTGSGGAEDLDENGPAQPPPRISVIARLQGDRVLSCDVARIRAWPHRDPGEPIGLTVELLDDRGLPMAAGDLAVSEAVASAMAAKAGGQLPGQHWETEVVCHVLIEDPGVGVALHIRRDRDTLWTRSTSKAPPKLGKPAASVEKNGSLRLDWQGHTSGTEEPEYWVRWSRDGVEWNVLAVGLRRTGLRIGADKLPAGQVRLQVLLHDGFQTASAETGVIEVPVRPPRANILYPPADGTVKAGRAIRLWARVTDCFENSGHPSLGTWFLDGEKIGAGSSIVVAAPPVGDHGVRFEVDDEHGSTSVVHAFTVK